MDNHTRRTPKQSRSRAIVDAIFEAVGRSLRDEGSQVTTHKVAEIAGVSVGSLYRYFPTKDSLLHAWLAKLIEARTQRLRRVLDGSKDRALQDVFGELIAAAVTTRREQGISEGVLLALFQRYKATDVLLAQDAVLLPSFSRLLREHERETRPLDPELSGYVLLHALRAVLVAAAHVPGLLEQPQFGEELIRLAYAYVAPEAAQVASQRPGRA